MYCFKKITESLLYKKVLQGKFSDQSRGEREFVCINDSCIHLYREFNKSIELKTKYDVHCSIRSAEIYSHSKDQDYLLLTTIADSLLMLGFNKANQTFQIISHYCYSHINDKQQLIHQIGTHICVIGDKQKLIVLGAYMKNLLIVEFNNGIFIQGGVIRLPNDIFHKIFASDEKNTSIEDFNIFSSELESKESLKTRVINIKLNIKDYSLIEKKEIIHVPSLKNQERQIEVPLDCTIYVDNQGYKNFLILTSLQIINVKLNQDSNRNKEESVLLKNLYQKDRKQVQPLSIKQYKYFQYILFNDGKCLYFNSFSDNLLSISKFFTFSLRVLDKIQSTLFQINQFQLEKGGFSTLQYGHPLEFEFIDAIVPDEIHKEWISISEKAISVTEADKSSCQVISSLPLFSSIINTAIDHRNGNLFSIMNGPINYLRKVTKGTDAKGLEQILKELPFKVKSAFYNQKDLDSNKQKYNIYLVSEHSSFVLQVKLGESPEYQVVSLSSFLKGVNQSETIKGMSFQENNRILIVLNSRIIIIDESSRSIVSEQIIQNDLKQTQIVIKCAVLDNELIFVQTQTNSLFAYHQEFINFKKFNVPQQIFDGLIPQTPSEQQVTSVTKQNIHIPQNDIMSGQISSMHLFKLPSQNNAIYLAVGYYNSTLKIYSIKLDNNQLNVQPFKNIHTNNILHDILFYNNSETAGLLLSQRNGAIQDLILLDYSKNINEQNDNLLTFHLEDNDIARIVKVNNSIYLQSAHSIYIYKQTGVTRDVVQLIMQSNKYFLNTPIINLIAPLTKEKNIIFSQENGFTLQSINSSLIKSEYKQIMVPLRTKDKTLHSRLYGSNQNGIKGQNMNCYLFKRILFNRELDAFLIIDQMGRIYIVNRNGYIIEIIEDLILDYPILKVVNMKKVNISEKDQYLFITTEKHGGLLVQLHFENNRINPNSYHTTHFAHKQIKKIHVVNQFILKNQQEQDVFYVSDVAVMGMLNFLFVCGQNIVFCYQMHREIDSLQEEEKLHFNKISELILPPQKQIICLDSQNNLILLGDLKDSVLIYNIQHKYEGGKHFFQWNLEKTEFNQRALKESVFVDKSNFIGLDKYGELFGSVTDQKIFHDANFNLHNFSLMNIRETGQIIKYFHYRKPSKLNHEKDQFNQLPHLEEQNQHAHKMVGSKQTVLYVCGIGGSIYQIILCDLLFNFEVEKYNDYILMIENILRQLKSNYSSQKKNSIDTMRKTRKFGNAQRFVDISLFENLSKQETFQVISDLQNQLKKEEAKMLNFEELKSVFDHIISLFSNS